MFLRHTPSPFSLRLKSNAFTAVTLFFMAITLCYAPVTLAQKISGQVVDNQGKGIHLARVNINGRKQGVLSDKQGFFTFKKLKSGYVELHIIAENFAQSSLQLTLLQDDISGVLIQLSSSVLEVLDVYATPFHSSTIESALPVNVISGDELRLKQASTLGETLKNEVGVHSSFYGSVTSSPIIRGLDGPRVLITQNGLDAGDVSRLGADHAVSTETSTATQIEVLRGPATLFYGSSALGGVVNVVDNRVPTSSDTIVEWLLQYNNVADEHQASFSLQKGLKIANKDLALHLDVFWRDADDYKLPHGFEAEVHEEADHLEESHQAEHEGEHEEGSASTLRNSASKSSGATAGLSYLFEQGFIGFSYGTMNRDYSIPGHAHLHDEEQEESLAGTQAEMQQDRLQLLSELNFEQGFIKQLAVKFAYTDYQHQEIEEGLIGTTFSNKSTEGRVDLYHQDYQGWQGAWTLHYKGSDFKAVGEEAFSPPSVTNTFALAWLEEKHYGDMLLQLGARVEQVSLTAEERDIGFTEHNHEREHEGKQVSFARQNFTPISSSVGLVWDYQTGYNLGLSAALSQRAPSAAELFSFGPHIGTHTFEVGAMFDLSLATGDEIHVELSSQAPELETSYSLDLTWRKFEGDFGFVVSAFYNHIKNYYYQQDTGLFFKDEYDLSSEAEYNEEGMPILIYQQKNVDMYGMEAQFVYQITSPLKVSLFGDYIRAQLTSANSLENSLPRIPPMRIGALLNYQGNSFDSEFSVNHYFEQNNTAPLETPTSAYSLVDMHVNYYLNNTGLDGITSDMVLYVKGQNLTDEVALVHSSFLKEIAPLPGRNFSMGIRGSF